MHFYDKKQYTKYINIIKRNLSNIGYIHKPNWFAVFLIKTANHEYSLMHTKKIWYINVFIKNHSWKFDSFMVKNFQILFKYYTLAN